MNAQAELRAAEAKKKTVFDGSKPGPGRGNKTVNPKSGSPLKRDIAAMKANSTVGQLAAKAGVSHHKLPQAAWPQAVALTMTTSLRACLAAMPLLRKQKPTTANVAQLPSHPAMEPTDPRPCQSS